MNGSEPSREAYIAALTTWGAQMCVYYYAYRALHNHNVASGPESVAGEPKVALA